MYVVANDFVGRFDGPRDGALDLRIFNSGVRIENGSGGSSPGCISSAGQSIVRPSSRGGVPVFKRPSANPKFPVCGKVPIAGASPSAACRNLSLTDMDKPRRKVPVVRTTAPVEISRPSIQFHAARLDRARSLDRRLPLDHLEVWNGADRGLHRPA